MLPKEHGAWAMLLVPLLLGVAVSGVSALQGVLVAGAVLLYLSLSALLEGVRRRSREPIGRFVLWAVLYLLLGGAAISLPLAAEWRIALPGLLAGLALPVELFYLWRRQERALVNGLAAVAALSCGVLATYLLGFHVLDRVAALLWLLCVLHFNGSLLFVRSNIRCRGNRRFFWLVVGYHAAVAALLVLLGYSLVAGSFGVGLARTLASSGRKLRPMTIGLIELVGSTNFLLLTLLTFRSLSASVL